MKVLLREPCGIEYQAEADVAGVTTNGDLFFTVSFPVDGATLMQSTVGVDLDAFPNSALLEVRASGG